MLRVQPNKRQFSAQENYCFLGVNVFPSKLLPDLVDPNPKLWHEVISNLLLYRHIGSKRLRTLG